MNHLKRRKQPIHTFSKSEEVSVWVVIILFILLMFVK